MVTGPSSRPQLRAEEFWHGRRLVRIAAVARSSG